MFIQEFGSFSLKNRKLNNLILVQTKQNFLYNIKILIFDKTNEVIYNLLYDLI